jgi:hypothetical protein
MGCECCKYGINGDDAGTCKAPMKFRIRQGCELDRGSNYTPPKKKRRKTEMKPIYIASCSFGKDSIATILLALEHNEPLDRVVFAEVMFDHSRGISGEIPEHIEWIYKTAIPKLEGMGVKVDVVRSKKDYVYYFKTIRQRGAYVGMRYGFPLGGKCIIQTDCKLAPIHEYYKRFTDRTVIQYVGIAANEGPRLTRLKDNQISLLDKYGYDEDMAMAKCKEYNLVSPIYSGTYRGGGAGFV